MHLPKTTRTCRWARASIRRVCATTTGPGCWTGSTRPESRRLSLSLRTQLFVGFPSFRGGHAGCPASWKTPTPSTAEKEISPVLGFLYTRVFFSNFNINQLCISKRREPNYILIQCIKQYHPPKSLLRRYTGFLKNREAMCKNHLERHSKHSPGKVLPPMLAGDEICSNILYLHNP